VIIKFNLSGYVNIYGKITIQTKPPLFSVILYIFTLHVMLSMWGEQKIETGHKIRFEDTRLFKKYLISIHEYVEKL